MRTETGLIPLVSTLTALAACTSTGTVTVTTYGEDFIEKGIEATEFADGWAVTFDTFLVVLGEFDATHGSDTIALPSHRLWDLKAAGPHTLATITDAPAIHFDEAGYALLPASASTQLGNATEAQLTAMKSAGFAVHVTGTATKGESTKSFDWGFTTGTRYVDCENEDGAGLVVVPGGTTDVQLTIHGDHLFLDDLVDPEATLHFQPLAGADANNDGAITLAELGAVDLTSASIPEGRYGTGSGPNVRTLADFVAAQVRSIGHWRGEGECRVTNP